MSGPNSCLYMASFYWGIDILSFPTISLVSFHLVSVVESCQKIVISGYRPQGNGPIIHTMSPVRMHKPTSYLTPGPLNLCEYQPVQNGCRYHHRNDSPITSRQREETNSKNEKYRRRTYTRHLLHSPQCTASQISPRRIASSTCDTIFHRPLHFYVNAPCRHGGCNGRQSSGRGKFIYIQYNYSSSVHSKLIWNVYLCVCLFERYFLRRDFVQFVEIGRRKFELKFELSSNLVRTKFELSSN